MAAIYQLSNASAIYKILCWNPYKCRTALCMPQSRLGAVSLLNQLPLIFQFLCRNLLHDLFYNLFYDRVPTKILPFLPNSISVRRNTTSKYLSAKCSARYANTFYQVLSRSQSCITSLLLELLSNKSKSSI